MEVIESVSATYNAGNDGVSHLDDSCRVDDVLHLVVKHGEEDVGERCVLCIAVKERSADDDRAAPNKKQKSVTCTHQAAQIKTNHGVITYM